MLACLAFSLLVTCRPLHSAGLLAEEIWSEDAAASVERAKSEGKDLLLLYTGSDWCPPCMKLESDVLSHREFLNTVTEKFVLVKFDFPKDKPQIEELKSQNQEWAEKFGITGYPTVVLLDSDQRPYAFSGFREGSAADYAHHLEKLHLKRLQRDEYLEQAADAEGIHRARLLDQALGQMTPEIAEVYYADVIEEIGELDAADEAGLRTKYFAERDKARRKEALADIAIAARLRRPDDAIAFIDTQLAAVDFTPDMQLQAMMYKLQLLRDQQNLDAAIKLLDQMIAIPGLTSTGTQRLIVKKAYLLAGAAKKEQAGQVLDQAIDARPDNLLLVIAKGELLDSLGNYDAAIQAYEQSMVAASSQPDLLVELVGAKADALVEKGEVSAALQTLDNFAGKRGVPADLRAEALLHKSMILRENSQRTSAIRAEARAIELLDSTREQGEFQRLIDQLKARRARRNSNSE